MGYVFLFISLIVIMCCLLGIRYSIIWLMSCVLIGSMLTTDTAKCSESVLCNMQVLLMLPIGIVLYIGLFIVKQIENRQDRRQTIQQLNNSANEMENAVDQKYV